MKILVTGHSGLIGKHLTERLIAAGHTIVGMSKSNRHSAPYEVITCDLRDPHVPKVVAQIKPEYVFHLAADAAEGKSMFSPIEISSSNYNTFMNVLVGALQGKALKRYIFTSSIAVYGAIHSPFREQDVPIPEDIYGVNKLAIEQSLKVMASVHNFEYQIIRPHNVYGEYQRMDDPYRNVLALWMNALLKNEPYVIFGDGSMRRCFSYVTDVVEVMEKAAFSPFKNMTFNVGSDRFYPLSDVSALLQSISGISINPKHLPTRVHEVHTAVSDHTLSNNLFGYRDTALREGLLRMWEWAKQKGPSEYLLETLELTSSHVPAVWQKP